MKYNKQTATKYLPLPEGKHDARLIGIIGLGLQKGYEFKGTVKAPDYAVNFIFEIPSLIKMEEVEGGEPQEVIVDGVKITHVVSKQVNLVSGERGALRPILEALTDKVLDKDDIDDIIASDIDFKPFIGTPVSIRITHKITNKGNTFANPVAIDALDKDLHSRVLAPTRETVYFNFEKPDVEVFKKLTRYNRERIVGAINSSELGDAIMKAQTDSLETNTEVQTASVDVSNKNIRKSSIQ